ncbi:hypothetical protein L596_022866 [Steinernema carpocapsae]|uniref:Peptidase S1 domain-containing protein n=1 Tax=Steinernema carpocapsae TaxID=34508 RepID=A0A4U5MC26_STECR|nr:hypothetical protein L596_022866 [Steinernema carpocapsae]
MQDFQVDKFWRNPTHTDAKQTGRDFGIILLKEPVQFSSRIAPACLPGSSTPLPDQIFVYGFGKHSMVLYDTERQPLENPRFQRLFVARVKQRKCKGMKMERFSDSFLATFCVIPYKGDGGPSMGDSGSGIMGKVGPKNQTVVFGNTVVAFMAEGHIVDNRSYVQDICRKIGLCYTLCDDVEKCLVI